MGYELGKTQREQDVVDTIPASPRALRKYLASLPIHRTGQQRASKEDRLALREVLRTERRRTPWAERELGLLKQTLGGAVVAHMILVGWALTRPAVDSLTASVDQRA